MDQAATDLSVARSVEIVLARPFVNVRALDAAGLRIGMWVTTSNGVGILTGCRIDGLGEVTLAKPDGTTKMELNSDDKAVPAVCCRALVDLRAAFIEEIPASRHEGEDHLRGFGYVNASEA